MKKLLCLLLAALMLAAAGCGKNTAETSEVSDTSAGVAVHVDYSKLTPYDPPEETYTLHEGYTKGEGLQARDDYGALIEYCGKESIETGLNREVLYLYGLVSSKGELVTDPIYQTIGYAGGFLVLDRPNPAFANQFDAPRCFVTLAAPDGSWVRELDDCRECYTGKEYMIALSMDNSVDVWKTTGERKAHFDGALFEEFLNGKSWDRSDSSAVVYCKDDKVAYAVTDYCKDDEGGFATIETLYLDLENGVVLDTPPEGYPKNYKDDASEPDLMLQRPKLGKRCEWQGCFTDPVTKKNYFYGKVEDHAYFTLFDGDGNVMVEPYREFPSDQPSPSVEKVANGWYATIEEGRFCYRTFGEGTLKFCYTMKTNSD